MQQNVENIVKIITKLLLWRGSRLGDSGNVEYPLIAIALSYTLIWSGSTSMGQL